MKKFVLKYNFNLKSDENFEKFIKVRMKEELSFLENPKEKQLQKIIKKKVKKNLKEKRIFSDILSTKILIKGLILHIRIFEIRKF